MSETAQDTKLHHMQHAAPEMLSTLLLIQKGIARGALADQSLIRHSKDGTGTDVVTLSSIVNAVIAKATGEPS